MSTALAAAPADGSHLNIVTLRGRLAADAEQRELPSGDLLCVFRLNVDRSGGTRGRVDCIDCASTGARVRQTLERASPGELIEVQGQLRRRFWRGGGGPASRYEVEVTTASRRSSRSERREATAAAGRRSGS